MTVRPEQRVRRATGSRAARSAAPSARTLRAAGAALGRAGGCCRGGAGGGAAVHPLNEQGNPETLVAAHPGNVNAVRHGVHSPRLIQARAAELAGELTQSFDFSPTQRLAVHEAAHCMAILEAIDRELDERVSSTRGKVSLSPEPPVARLSPARSVAGEDLGGDRAAVSCRPAAAAGGVRRLRPRSPADRARSRPKWERARPARRAQRAAEAWGHGHDRLSRGNLGQAAWALGGRARDAERWLAVDRAQRTEKLEQLESSLGIGD